MSAESFQLAYFGYSLSNLYKYIVKGKSRVANQVLTFMSHGHL